VPVGVPVVVPVVPVVCVWAVDTVLCAEACSADVSVRPSTTSAPLAKTESVAWRVRLGRCWRPLLRVIPAS
jgi:hypothetical protein